MADWTNPVLTSLYTDLLDILKDRDFDLAAMFSPTYSTASNIQEGTVRWNPTSKIWEIRNASAGWDPLATLYGIDVDKLDGQHGAYYLDWNNFTNVPATFAPSTHTHDDRYYTETEADARYGFTIDNSSNNIRLKAADGTILSTLQVAYAAAAGDAATVAGFAVDQNLRTTDSPSFAGATVTGNATVQGDVFVGKDTGGNSHVNFYDDANNLWRTFRWKSTGSKWQVEDVAGAFHELFHEGHLPTWSEVSGKPSTFAPSAHGHAFDGTNTLQLRSETDTAHGTLTGLAGELVYENVNKRLYLHDAATVGGKQIAFTSDIPAPQNLSNYARKDIAETFASTLAVTGDLTGSAQVQMLKGRILDTSAAATTKVMLSIEGDSDALQIINHAAGDYEIKNPGRGNSIRIMDSTGGVQVRTNSATRLIVNDSGIEVTGDILLNGNSMWHSGNDGAGSGLDADKLDGVEAVNFLQRFDRQNVDFDTITNGIYGIGSTATNVPTELLQGVLVDFFPTSGSVGFQIAANHTGDFYYRGGNGPNYGGGGDYTPWRKIWHEGSDGDGSGLDADMLDGIHASSFMRNDSSQTMRNVLTIIGTGTIAGTHWANGWFRIGDATIGWSMDSNEIYNSAAAAIGTLVGDLTLDPAGDVVIGGNRVLTTADSGTMDAVTLDGLDSTQFLRSDADDSGTNLTVETLTVTKSDGISWENGVNRITHNDGGGNVQIRFGHKHDAGAVFTHAGSAFYIGGDVDSTTAGTLDLKVASNPGAGTGIAVTWGPKLSISATALTWGGDTIWHAGNDGTGSGLDADLLDGLNSDKFMRSDTNTSTTGNLTVTGTMLSDTVQTRTGAPLILNAGNSASYATTQTGEQIYLNAEGGLSINTSPDDWVSGWAGRKTTVIDGTSITIDGQTAFHDGYHPNADKWTTARTITLGGDLGGSVSMDGSANQTLTATVTNLGVVKVANKEKADLTSDGQFGFDSSQGLLVYRTQQGVTGDAVTVLDGANVEAGSGINIANLGAGSTGTGRITFTVDETYLDGIYIKNEGGSVTGSTRATQAEAKAGSNNNQIMTPLRVKQSIDANGGLARLNPGTAVRSRRDTEVSRWTQSYVTRHHFDFIQKGTIRVSYDHKASHAGEGAAARVRRYRDEVWTTLATYTATTTYVTQTVDVAVMPGDQVTVEYQGGGSYDPGTKGSSVTYYYGYLQNVRFQTNGEDLYPGVSYKVEGNSA